MGESYPAVKEPWGSRWGFWIWLFICVAMLAAVTFLPACSLTPEQKATILDYTAEALSAGSEAGPIREASMPAAVGMNAAAWILRLVAEFLRRKEKEA